MPVYGCCGHSRADSTPDTTTGQNLQNALYTTPTVLVIAASLVTQH